MARVTLEQIKEALPDGSYDVMGAGYILTHCPWHEDDNRSLLVYPDGWWHCLGECQASGPNSRLYGELASPGTTKRGGRDTPRGKPISLPASPGDQIRFVEDAHATIKRNSSFRWYCEERGISGRIEPCELGWHEGWLIIPVKSRDDEISGIIARSGPQAQKMTGLRFTQPHGQRAMVYCPDWSLVDRTEGPVFITFGMIDALTLSELRLPTLTTTGGAKSFRPEWLKDIRKPIVIVPDAGEETQAYSLAKGLGWRGRVKRLRYPNGWKDPNDYMQSGQGKALLYELAGGS